MVSSTKTAISVALLVCNSPILAEDYSVSADTELQTALNHAAHNADAADTITVTAPITLAGNAQIDAGLTITGLDTTLSGNLSNARDAIFAGQWQVDEGPHWSGSPPNGPLTYTGQEAAALLFGGLPADYVISTIGTDPDTIDYMAWYSVIGAYGNQDNGGSILPQDYVSNYLGLYYGPTNGYPYGDLSAPASAYVDDNAIGSTFTNYAFALGNPKVGSLTKNGIGTLTISGANTYTGLTTVNGGTLVLSGGQAIWDDGKVLVNSAGTLSVATDETIGSLAGSGAVDLAASLTTGGNGDSTIYSGTISGAGGLTKVGTGSMVLSDANTYAGGTTISDGTLIGAASSFGTGTITDNAALIIDQPINAELANSINGTGSFVKRGIGTLNMTGTNGLTGPTTVEAGGLRVNGSLANSAVTLNRGTFLGGNGTTGSVTALAGSTVAPGNSVGTLHVSGNYVQAGHATYVAETGPVGRSDLIDVTGTATIEPGAELVLVKGEPLVAGTTYTVLTAAGGVTGSFAFAGGMTTAFLGFAQEIKPGSINIAYKQLRTFGAAAITVNEQSTAGALDTIRGPSAVVTALQLLPNDADAQAAFDQLSGEIHPATRTVMHEDSRLTRNAVLAHLASSDDAHGGAWVESIGNWGRSDSRNGIAPLKRNTVGIVGGVDITATEGVRLGFAGAYTNTDVGMPRRNSSATINTAHILAYLGADLGGLCLRTGFGYGSARIETNRAALFDGFSDSLAGHYDGKMLQTFGEAGYKVPLGGGYFEPTAGVTYSSVKTKAFTEVGGPAALHGNAKRQGIIASTVAMRFSTPTGGRFQVDGLVGWQHTYGNMREYGDLGFTGSSLFRVNATRPSRNAGVLQANASYRVSRAVSFKLSYDGVAGTGGRDNMVRGGLKVVF